MSKTVGDADRRVFFKDRSGNAFAAPELYFADDRGIETCLATMTTILSSNFSMLELPLNTQSSWPMFSSKFKWSIIVPAPVLFHPLRFII